MLPEVRDGRHQGRQAGPVRGVLHGQLHRPLPRRQLPDHEAPGEPAPALSVKASPAPAREEINGRDVCVRRRGWVAGKEDGLCTIREGFGGKGEAKTNLPT